MSFPVFDMKKAQAQIDNCPAIGTRDFAIGNHVFTVEMITTIWHMRKGHPDYVFRVSVDGVPTYDVMGRAFFHACTGFRRTLTGPKVLHNAGRRPEWLPEGITIKQIDAGLDQAISELLFAYGQ